MSHLASMTWLNTLRPRQDGRHFPDDIFRCIFLNESIWIAINISLSFVPEGPIDNIPTLVQIMAWHRSGDKPLSEPMMVSLPTHICVTPPQWVKWVGVGGFSKVVVLSLSLDLFFKILRFQVAFLIFFCVAIFSQYLFLVGLLLQSVDLFQSKEIVKYLELL